MGALAAELRFSCCHGQLASRISDFSKNSSRNDSACSVIRLSSITVESNHRLVASSTGRRLPLTTRRRQQWREKVLEERGIRGGNLVSLARKSVAVHVVVAVGVEASKPSFFPLEQITGEAHFDQVLSEAMERNQPVIIDWLAEWCRKCIYLKPKLEKLAAEYHPQIKFYYVDVNKVSQALVKRAEVTKMPTIQLWGNGQRLAEVIGGHQAWLVMDEVREMIRSKK